MNQILTSRPVTTLAPFCNKPWLEDDDIALKEYAEQGRSRKEIAVLTGRTVTAVKGRCQALGIHLRRDTYGGFAPRPYERMQVDYRSSQEARDRRFIRAIASSMKRGEHLPGASNVG